jgi:hypothetical protein
MAESSVVLVYAAKDRKWQRKVLSYTQKILTGSHYIEDHLSFPLSSFLYDFLPNYNGLNTKIEEREERYLPRVSRCPTQLIKPGMNCATSSKETLGRWRKPSLP